METAAFFYHLEQAGLITRRDAGRAYEILQKNDPYDSPGRVLIREKMLTERAFYEYVRDYLGMNPKVPYSEPGYGVAGSALTPRGSKSAGEFYGFFPLSHGTMAVILCDVCGEGLESGILAMLLYRDIIRSRKGGKTVPSALVRGLNRLGFQYLGRDQYACFAVLLLDTQTHSLDYCIAGAPPLLIYRAQERHIEELNQSGPPIGILPNAEYRNGRIQFNRGDAALAASDGAYLVTDRKGTMLGLSGIKTCLREHGTSDTEDILKYLRRDIRIHNFMRGLRDDISLIVIKKLPRRNA